MMMAAAALVAAPASARAQPPPSAATEQSASGPSTLGLVAIGAALAVPDYVLALAQHEGMHALFATAFGAKVTYVRLLPDEDREGHLRLGDTGWTDGSLTNGQRAAVFLAPKMADLVGLSTYAALDLTDTVPRNKVAQLSILVVATGMWVDFAHDIAATGTYSDVIQADSLLGAHTEEQRLPLRVAHGVLAVATAIPILHGYARLFRTGPASAGRADERRTERAAAEPFIQGDVLGVQGTF
jgi:hypothetical protein